MEQSTSQAPFPILPPALQICSIIGALYPHFDIVDDKVVFRTGRSQLDQSLHATSLGSCLLLLGFYCCQFLTALGQLRKEYLGSLGLIQLGHLALLVARVVLFPDSLTVDPVGTATGALAAVLVATLVLYDGVAVPPRSSAKAPLPDPEAVARAHSVVKAATQVLWLLFAVQFVLPFLVPGLLPIEVPPSHKPCGSLAAVLTPLVALARLMLFVSGRLAARQAGKQKGE